MPETGDAPDDFLEDVFQDISPTLGKHVDRQFLPWHKPRKYYIRLNLWCSSVQRLIRELRLNEDDELKYFGFPGEDFLDVRMMHGVCKRAKIRIKYFGVDSTASYIGNSAVFNLQRHEVYGLGIISDDSRVIGLPFESAGEKNSLVMREARKHFEHFDVVNIDLSGSAGQKGGGFASCFPALRALLDSQVENRTKPWLLFLATRANREDISASTQHKLLACTLKNVEESSDFGERLLDRLDIPGSAVEREAQRLLERVRNEEDGSAEDFAAADVDITHALWVSLFGLSISKWLLMILIDSQPKNKAALLPGYSYRVYADEPDMLSLGFKIEPIVYGGADISGLARRSREPVAVEERSLALEMVDKISEVVDVDDLLHQDADLYNRMMEKSAKLLESAHYDPDRYAGWCEKTKWSPMKRSSTDSDR